MCVQVGVAPRYLLHLTGSVVVGRHAAALLFDLHGSGFEETVSDRPLGHVTSAVAPNLHLGKQCCSCLFLANGS